MLGKKRRTSAILLMAATLVIPFANAPASADLSKKQSSTDNVTQYLTLQYNTTQCAGETKYKLNSVSRRWHRSTLNRKVRVEVSNTVADGMKCNWDPFYQVHSQAEYSPCFGCDGYDNNWTAPYQSTYSWPYIGDACCVEMLGAIVKSRVRNLSGDTLGWLCTNLALSGNINC